MYSVYADDLCIYNDSYILDELRLIDPVLTLEDNAAGSFEMTLPPDNIGYSAIKRLITEIIVKKNNEELWRGRVVSETVDFWRRRKLYCEGELAYLNDTVQPQDEFHDFTVEEFLRRLITRHNGKVSVNKQFRVGTVTVTDPNDSLYRYTNFEKTIECVKDKLIDRLGGHLRIRKEDGVRYVDYLDDKDLHVNSQVINFGENLLDFVTSYDLSEFATVILPLGQRIENTNTEESDDSSEVLPTYLDVSLANGGNMYVRSEAAYLKYGRIEKVVHWDDVTSSENLLKKAKKYLEDTQFEDMRLEVSALDLSNINVDAEPIKLLDKITVVSKPHGLNREFPVTKLIIPLDDLPNEKIELGLQANRTLTEILKSNN